MDVAVWSLSGSPTRGGRHTTHTHALERCLGCVLARWRPLGQPHVSLCASHLPEDGAPGRGAAATGDSFERDAPPDAAGAPSGASGAGAFLASAAAGAGETPVAALDAVAAAAAGAAGEAEEEDGR
eukprot:scaffold110920_cov48-Phaeocystis_antarctica.AAC.3